MTTKLTLTIDDQVIDSAKEYARKKGESLSGIMENYLKSITASEVIISDKVRKMMGVINLEVDFNYRKTIGSVIAPKNDDFQEFVKSK